MISPAHLRGMTVAWSALLLRHVLATNPQMPSKPASRALVIPRLPIARPAVYTLIVADHKTEIAQRGATQNAETSRAKFWRSHISREFRRAATLNFSGPPMIFLLQYLDLKANRAPSIVSDCLSGQAIFHADFVRTIALRIVRSWWRQPMMATFLGLPR